MKKLVFLLVFVFVSLHLFAQGQESIGAFENKFEIMLGAAVGSDDNIWINVNTTFSTNLNKLIQIGGGIGYSKFLLQSVPKYIAYNAVSVFADFRVFCPISRVVSFVGVTDVGLMINDHSSIKNSGIGVLVFPQAGFRFRLSDKGVALNTRFQYQYTTNPKDNVFGCTIGLSF